MEVMNCLQNKSVFIAIDTNWIIVCIIMIFYVSFGFLFCVVYGNVV